MHIVLSNSDTYFGVWSKGSRNYRWIFPDLQRDPLLTCLNSLTFFNRMSTTSQMLRLSAQIHKTHLLSFRGRGWHVIPSSLLFSMFKLVKSSFLSLSHINGTQNAFIMGPSKRIPSCDLSANNLHTFWQQLTVLPVVCSKPQALSNKPWLVRISA